MIVVVGEALVDLVVDTDGRVEAALGGAPFNTARACGRLGAEVAFCGAVSNDRFGSLLAARLGSDGVSTEALVRVTSPTTLAAAELDENGSANYHFYIDGTSAPLLGSPPDLSAADAVFTGGLALVLEPMATTVEAMLSSGPEGCLVMVDINCRPRVIGDRDRYVERILHIVASTDVVKASDEDLDYLFGGVGADDAAQRLLDLGTSAVLVTAGGGDIAIHTSTGRRTVGVDPVDVVDTIGAGDSFAGGFLTWWIAQGHTHDGLAHLDVLEAAVGAAGTVAGATCTRRGADPPWRSELPTDWAL